MERYSRRLALCIAVTSASLLSGCIVPIPLDPVATTRVTQPEPVSNPTPPRRNNNNNNNNDNDGGGGTTPDPDPVNPDPVDPDPVDPDPVDPDPVDPDPVDPGDGGGGIDPWL
jgi:hypothetical protein